MEKLRFGVIGTGRFGKHYMRLLQELEGVSLAATANRTDGNAEAVLVNPNIDCMVIATPASTHFGYIKNALQHGKHVLVEKPMVLSTREAETVRALVQKSGKVFMVAHQFIYNDYIQYLGKEFGKGVFGKIKRIKAEQMYPGPVREDVGVFWDAAPHEFAILDFLLGPADIKKVNGEKKHTSGKPVEDQVFAQIEFTDGVSFELTLSSVAPAKVRKMEFVGEKGTAVFDDLEVKDKLKLFLDGQDFIPEISAEEPLRNELEHFITCVKTGQTPLTDIEHGIRVTRNLESVYQNLRNSVK